MANIMSTKSVIMLLYIAEALNWCSGQSDVTMTCPQKWCAGETVTLYCEVVKTSIIRLCGTPVIDVTEFRVDPNTGNYGTQCAVGPSGYACNYVLGSGSVPPCGCHQNATHYTFMHEINATATLHNGNWECEKICSDASGNNPLSTNTSQNCQNVKVTDCKYVTSDQPECIPCIVIPSVVIPVVIICIILILLFYFKRPAHKCCCGTEPVNAEEMNTFDLSKLVKEKKEILNCAYCACRRSKNCRSCYSNCFKCWNCETSKTDVTLETNEQNHASKGTHTADGDQTLPLTHGASTASKHAGEKSHHAGGTSGHQKEASQH